MRNCDAGVRRTLLYIRVFTVIGLCSVPLSGCGGGSTSSNQSGGQLTIISGNWGIGLPGGASANGALMQSGNTITGTLHVSGSPCFDPAADLVMVTGSAPNDGSFTLAFSSSPIRGQVISVNGTWDPNATVNRINPKTSPNGPQPIFNGTAAITGGSCAGQSSIQAQIYEMSGNPVDVSLGTPNGSSDSWQGNATGALTQSPDSSGIFHVAGTWRITGSHFFTTGTIASSAVQGQSVQMTMNTDSGQLVGSGSFFQELEGGTGGFVHVGLTFTVQGGTCNGETVNAIIHV
jgi:hypothetical protein